MLIETRKRIIPIKKEGKVKIIVKLSLPRFKADSEEKNGSLAAERINAFYAEIEEKYIEFLKAREIGGIPLVVSVNCEVESGGARITVIRKTEIRDVGKAAFISRDVFDSARGYVLSPKEERQKLIKKQIKEPRVKKTEI